MSGWMKAGIPCSNAPGVEFEYSKYGFAILGRIVANVSGRPNRDYVDREILAPLGMTSTKWEEALVPDALFARGYRRDRERWVSFFLAAYPPRDNPEEGPVRRSTRRLMQMAAMPYRPTARRERVADRGRIRLVLTLAPTSSPSIQWLETTSAPPPQPGVPAGWGMS